MNKKTIIVSLMVVSLALASVFVFLLLRGSLFGFHGTPPGTPIIPVELKVYLNSSEGFNSSIMVAASSGSPLFVLPPGGNGTIPFSVYSDAKVPFDAFLGVSSESPVSEINGVQFSVYPFNFTVNPGEQVNSLLTITADKEVPSTFFMPTLGIHTNKEQSPYYIGGNGVSLPALFVANFTPACIYFANGVELKPPIVYPTPLFPPPHQIPWIPTLVGFPTIELIRGEKTLLIFSCSKQEALSINTTTPVGLKAEFSPNPLNIVFSDTGRVMYGLTVTADPQIDPGTYEVKLSGSLGSYPFKGSLHVSVK